MTVCPCISRVWWRHQIAITWLSLAVAAQVGYLISKAVPW